MVKIKNSKHQNLVSILYNSLKDRKYVNYIETNLEYKNGEFDVLARQNKHFVYYEIKTNDTRKAILKARRQTRRGTKYINKKTGLDCYGVYVTINSMKVICKNGILKWNKKDNRKIY